MDDDDDRGYSRAPELEDLVGLCRALNDEEARYILIGGFAVIVHGYVRATICSSSIIRRLGTRPSGTPVLLSFPLPGRFTLPYCG